ncbi:RNA polymerase sigma factor SigJ [Actinopolymorpha pittospori]|nr:RNA polymerase sigma factor SigJ [Actinopolymorpha pittospori]
MVGRDGMPDEVVDEVVEAQDARPPGREAEGTDVAGEFARRRESLFAVAYRILGTRADAEDVVQEAWLRWSRVDPGEVEDPRGYLFRLVTNQAIDQLRRVRARRESYVGPWLPEPLLTAFEVSDPSGADGGPDVGRQVELAESVSMGLLVVLETLAPVERAVFVLHEAFGYTYAEIGAILGRTERGVRQLAYRARQHVQARRPRQRPTASQHREITERFLAAAVGGDLGALMDLLAPDVTMWADADGRSETPREALHGAVVVARYLASVREFWPDGLGVEVVEVNTGPGAVVRANDHPYLVFALELDGQRVQTIRAVLNPDKLAHLR